MSVLTMLDLVGDLAGDLAGDLVGRPSFVGYNDASTECTPKRPGRLLRRSRTSRSQGFKPRSSGDPVTVSVRFVDADESALGSEHCATCGALRVARIHIDQSG